MKASLQKMAKNTRELRKRCAVEMANTHETKKVYTTAQKSFVCELRKSGKNLRDISTLFTNEYGYRAPDSTLATIYNADNMEKLNKNCHSKSPMSSVETTINQKQRPSILVDLEFALAINVKKHNSATRRHIKAMALELYSNLRALRIYHYSGIRVNHANHLTEEEIKCFLDTDNTLCPLCKNLNLDTHPALLQRLHDHVEQGCQTFPNSSKGFLQKMA